MFDDVPTWDARKLLNAIDYLPSVSATSGAVIGAHPGWSSTDEMALAMLNQAILLRRMWAAEGEAHKLEPIRMPWHNAASGGQQPMSSSADTRAFFGATRIRQLRKE